MNLWADPQQYFSAHIGLAACAPSAAFAGYAQITLSVLDFAASTPVAAAFYEPATFFAYETFKVLLTSPSLAVFLSRSFLAF